MYDGGALLRAGNTNQHVDGGTMTGLFVRSSEYLEMQSDQIVTLDSTKNFSFISVNKSSDSDLATIVLPDGNVLAQEKYIMIVDVPLNTTVCITGNIISYGSQTIVSLWTDASHTSAQLVWNNVKNCWYNITGLLASSSNPFN